MIYQNKEEYDGNYENGVKSGQGTFIYQDGSKYVGNYVNNNQEGLGQMFFADGRYYEGEFKNNKIVNEEDIQIKKPNEDSFTIKVPPERLRFNSMSEDDDIAKINLKKGNQNIQKDEIENKKEEKDKIILTLINYIYVNIIF